MRLFKDLLQGHHPPSHHETSQLYDPHIDRAHYSFVEQDRQQPLAGQQVTLIASAIRFDDSEPRYSNQF